MAPGVHMHRRCAGQLLYEAAALDVAEFKRYGLNGDAARPGDPADACGGAPRGMSLLCPS
jgi:hypothetical protein